MNALRAEQAMLCYRNESELLFPEQSVLPEFHRELVFCMVGEFKGYRSPGLPSVMNTETMYLGNFYQNTPWVNVGNKDRGSKENPLIPLLILRQRILDDITGKTVAFFGTCLTRDSDIPEANINFSAFCFSNCGCGDVRLSANFKIESDTSNQAKARTTDMMMSIEYFEKMKKLFGKNSIDFLSLETKNNQWFLGQMHGDCKPEDAVHDYENRWGRSLVEVIKQQEPTIIRRLY